MPSENGHTLHRKPQRLKLKNRLTDDQLWEIGQGNMSCCASDDILEFMDFKMAVIQEMARELLAMRTVLGREVAR